MSEYCEIFKTNNIYQMRQYYDYILFNMKSTDNTQFQNKEKLLHTRSCVENVQIQ